MSFPHKKTAFAGGFFVGDANLSHSDGQCPHLHCRQALRYGNSRAFCCSIRAN